MTYPPRGMAPSRLDFRIDALASGSQARAATFQTLHGPVETPVFMPVGTQAAVQRAVSGVAGGRGLARAAREHLPPAAASGAGGLPPYRRHPPVHELGRPRAHRLRRVPDLLAAPLARADRRGGRVPELRRRQGGAAEPRAVDRHAGRDRQRHHDGARPVRQLRGRPRLGAGRPGAHPPLGRAQPRRAGRLGPVAVRHRAGSALRRPARRERRVPVRPALRRPGDRRAGGR